MRPPLTLADLVRARAAEQPDAPLLAGREARRTWGEFARRAARGADALRRLGLRPGDRAAILAGNGAEWLEAFFAIHAAGGIVVPLNDRLTPPERRRLLDDTEATVLIGAPELVASTGFAGPTLAFGPDYESALAAAADDAPPAALDPGGVAVIAYTSGTTGMPKGVMWSHAGLFAAARATPFPPEVAGGGRILLCAPLHAGGAIVMACNALAIGATLVITRFTPEAVLRALAEDGIEFTGLVPTMMALLADAAPPGWRAPQLRRIYYGGGPMPPQLYARAQALFDCEFQQSYGMTETCIFGTRLDPADHAAGTPERLASAGKPMPGVAIKVVGDDGAELPPGSAGEILIRSPGTMLGYWRREDENGHAFADGWYRTRDIGRLDADGYLTLVDRRDDMVKSGGFNVAPAEVEEVLASHPDVEEAAVIGVPDDRWGERVTAVVRRRAGAAPGEADLVAFCRARLANYKVPRWIIVVDAPLPRNALGKVLRSVVRAQYRVPQSA